MNLFEKMFGTKSQREIKKIQPTVDKILSMEEEYSNLSDKELRAKTEDFKKRLSEGQTIDDILPEAYATVREAAWRVLGMKPFRVQVIGAIFLHRGSIAEMKVGEGKTLVATMPLYLNALLGKGAWLVTVNDYLAKRDANQMGKVFSFLGLSTGVILSDMDLAARRAAYACDITYGTNNEFGFDYLRDNMITSVNERVQRGLHFAIIDEVDSVLIDDARTPLIISGFANTSNEGYLKADKFVRKLKKLVIVEDDDESKLSRAIKNLEGEEESSDKEKYGNADYVVEEKKKTVMLTEKGIAKAEAFYHIDNLSDPENMEINHYITRAIKAYGIFKKDVDYVVKDGKIIIVDEGTGRLMDGRRYSEGIHQAIEAKEGVKVQHESKTLATITLQNFFRKFEKIAGMTGTAKTEEEEFKNIYYLDVVEIPTNKEVKRIDKEDAVYLKRQYKINAIIDRIKNCYEKGQPILVGTVSVEKSEELSALLKKERIPHNVLNAKYHEQEAKIVAQAGKYKAVTISTNMAGRGTDIILGGNPEYLALEELRKEGYSEELVNEANGYSNTEDKEILDIRKKFNEKYARIKDELQPEAEKVKELGGLYILGTERHESRRIDNQLRGRSGRQGDIGVSEFVLSLEDDLMRVFGGERVQAIFDSLSLDTEVQIDAKIISNQIERCQKRIESIHYQQRKYVLEYDEIISRQRDMIYEERNKIFDDSNDYKEMVKKIILNVVKSVIENNVLDKKYVSFEDIENIKSILTDYKCVFLNFDRYTEDNINSIKYNDFFNDLTEQADKLFETIYSTTVPQAFNDFAKKLFLFLIDRYWQDHLVGIDDLKQGIGLRAYGQINPVDAFKSESFEMFYDMMDSLKVDVFTNLMAIYQRFLAEQAIKIVRKQ